MQEAEQGGQMDQFIEVLFRALAAPTITLEHDYASLLFSVDRCCHSLFRGVQPLIEPPGEDGDYHLTKFEFIEKRLLILEAMLASLSARLDEEQGAASRDLGSANQRHLTSVTTFFSTMKDIHTVSDFLSCLLLISRSHK